MRGFRGRPGEGLEGQGGLRRARAPPLAIVGSLGRLALPPAFSWIPWNCLNPPQDELCDFHYFPLMFEFYVCEKLRFRWPAISKNSDFHQPPLRFPLNSGRSQRNWSLEVLPLQLPTKTYHGICSCFAIHSCAARSGRSFSFCSKAFGTCCHCKLCRRQV